MLANLTAQPFAHRGLHDLVDPAGAPENSLPALALARQAGYGSELDVHLSADGVPMVFHDETLDRLTPALGPLARRTADELGRLRLAGGGETIPTLAQGLASAAPSPLYVELKGASRPGHLERACLALLAGYAGPWLLASFNPRRLAWLARHAPEAVRGRIVGVGRPGGLELERPLGFGRPDLLAVQVAGLADRRVRRLRARGLPILTWTVRTAEDLRTGRELADQIVFEGLRPEG